MNIKSSVLGPWLQPSPEKFIEDASFALHINGLEAIEQDKKLVKLFALDRGQADEIARLRVVVGVLSQLLVDANVIDAEVLSSTVSVALAELEAAKRPAEDSSRAVVKCIGCKEECFACNTQITEDGVVCDECYYRPEST